MDVDITDIKSVTPAMVKHIKTEEPEKFAHYQAALEGIAQVKTELGVLANRNTREALTNRLLLALLDGDTPDRADIDALRAAYKAVDESPVKSSIVGE